MELIRRRRGLIGSKGEIEPLYKFENVQYKQGGTDTGLLLFQEDQDYTVLTEFVMPSGHTASAAWNCQANLWQPYGVGIYANYFNRYFSNKRFADYFNTVAPGIGTIHRDFFRYDSVKKRIDSQIRGYSKQSATNVNFIPASGTLKIGIASKGGTQNVLLSLSIYDKALSDAVLAKWFSEDLED